jgi:hypothetical protein
MKFTLPDPAEPQDERLRYERLDWRAHSPDLHTTLALLSDKTVQTYYDNLKSQCLRLGKGFRCSPIPVYRSPGELDAPGR